MVIIDCCVLYASVVFGLGVCCFLGCLVVSYGCYFAVFFVVACLAVVDYCGVCVDWLFGMLLTWLLV